ncbi:Ghrelin [Bagarius yarrelli]|uniref:Ghrelin n=1 Tax=Bagarius yarrelli TaxID=175774 RepID=A0A556TR65_BAGYA|nr:Ghrelin [Bagarius yarrelli]
MLAMLRHVMLLLCIVSLWTETVMCGSSFLSPAQRPQSRGDRKPPRVGRRSAAELEPPVPSEDKLMVSAPFQLVVSLSEDNSQMLQRMLLDVLSDPPSWSGF